MQQPRRSILAVLSIALSALVLMAPLTSQVNTYINGNVLTADQLNSEFGNIYSTINALDNANLTSAANISPAKISATIDGTAISRDGGTGALSVSVDNSTIETNSDQIRVKDAGVTAAKLASNSVTTAKIVDLNVTTGKIADDAITGVKISPGSVVTSDMADNAVTIAKMEPKTNSATAALGQVALSASSGLFSGTSGDITNLTVTITVRGGPVLIQAVPAGNSGPGFFGYFFADGNASVDLYRDGVLAQETMFGNFDSGVYVPAGSVHFFEQPAAGTYVYKLRVSGSPTSFNAAHVKLMVYEL